MQGSEESFQTERIAAVLREKEKSESIFVLKVDPHYKMIDDRVMSKHFYPLQEQVFSAVWRS